MELDEPLHNTSTLGWPSCCHMPYWKTGEQTFLSTDAVFSFLGADSSHGYGCMECHLQCSGISDAFAKSADDNDDHCFLSLEAFVHLMFGGHPPCCVNRVTNNLVTEIRHFIIEVLVEYPSHFSTNQADVSTQETQSGLSPPENELSEMCFTGTCIKLETSEGTDEEDSSEAMGQTFLHIADSLPQVQQNVTNCYSPPDEYQNHNMYNMAPVAIPHAQELNPMQWRTREFSDTDTNAMYCLGLEGELKLFLIYIC